MSNFDFGQFSGGTGFASFSEETQAALGPYIPELRDCLNCGVCLGGCPTYRVKQDEPYSPRGRVRMLEKVVKKTEPLGIGELDALEACTLCRACETVCPSKMQYGELYRQAMEAITEKQKKSLAIKLLLNHVVTQQSSQRFLAGLIQIYQRSGTRKLTKLLPFSVFRGGLKQFESLLPVPFKFEPVSNYAKTSTAVQNGKVALFKGCVANIFDTQTHNASIKLLTRLGYDVEVPEEQTCCGAVYAHNDEFDRARSCARKNNETFSASSDNSIIFNSSGCGAFLNEYQGLLKDNEGDNKSIAPLKAEDVMEFLAKAAGLGALGFRELKLKVAVHEPCSQRNVLKNPEWVYQLLGNIPGLEVNPLPDNAICCGAGGTRMVTHPDIATPLRDEKVDYLLQSGADILVSTNLNCALHLSSGVREVGHKVEVMHPVRLLANQLI